MEYSKLTTKALSQPNEAQVRWMETRFRGFMPVVIDIETGGFNEETDALLEVAAVMIGINENMQLFADRIFHCHVEPFKGANIEESALKINKIDPFHPLRMAEPEKVVLEKMFAEVAQVSRLYKCSRAILTGHNAFFDLKFLDRAAKRNAMGEIPFHQFSTLDTVSLGALAYGQTILSKIAVSAGIQWDDSNAHSAIYDAYVTAEIFCSIVNRYPAQILQNSDQGE